MNEPTNGNGGIPKMSLQCVKCGQSWSITPHPPEVYNLLRSSGCSLAHEKIIRCPNAKCMQPYVLMIQNVSLMLAAQPVSDEVAAQIDGSNIVVPSLKLM